MEPELVVLILAVLTVLAIFFGVLNLTSVKRFEVQKEEAERIFRQRFFGDDKKTRMELDEFFRKAKRPIFLSALSFVSAFVLFIMVAKRLWPSDSLSKTLLSLLILLVIFGGPLMMLILAEIQIFFLKKETMRRFDED